MSANPAPTLASLDARLTAVEATVATLKPAASNATTTPAPDPVAAFIAKYAALDPAAFSAKYGVPIGKSLSPLTQAATVDDVIAYARNGYNPAGVYRNGPVTQANIDRLTPAAYARNAVVEAANRASVWDTGFDTVAGDVVAIGFLAGIFVSFGFASASMGEGIYGQTPADYKGWPVEAFVAKFLPAPTYGAGPSGGQAG